MTTKTRRVSKAAQRGGVGAPQEPTVTDLRLLLIGSGSFALPSFAALAAAEGFDIVGILTAVPRPSGRSGELRATPVAAWAETLRLPVIETARVRDEAVLRSIEGLGVDVGVLADFGQIVPPRLLAAARHGILNLHPSLLPHHRGASPIPAAIRAGDSETGVCTILMDEGLDTGAILDTVVVPLHGDERAPLLKEQLARLAAERIVATVRSWVANRLTARPQGDQGVSIAPRLRRSDGRISAATSAVSAWRSWRAYQPWPGIFVEIPGIVERLRLDHIESPLPASGAPSGSLSIDGERLILHLDGGSIPLRRVTPAGGREMDGAELVRGRPELVAPHARIAP